MKSLADIQPLDVEDILAVRDGSLLDGLTAAAANGLRGHLGLADAELAPGRLRDVVTRRDPSLDNYFAELLLRTCHAPDESLPRFDEIVLREPETALSSEKHPRVVGAVLIGVGGQTANGDFADVYDEHVGGGERLADSAAAVVVQRHLAGLEERPQLKALRPLLLEHNRRDARGGVPGMDHCISIAKGLNRAQFAFPGNIVEPLPPAWKRAIWGVALSSLCMEADALASVNHGAAAERLRAYWRQWLERSGYAANGAADYVESRVAAQAENPSHFILRKVLLAMERRWRPAVTEFVLSFLFDTLLQLQEEYGRISLALEDPDDVDYIRREMVKGGLFMYLEVQPRDLLPHRALISALNQQRQPGILVVYDAAVQSTAVFRNNHLPHSAPQDVWPRFVRQLQALEPHTWYVPTQPTGAIAGFVINRTRSFMGLPPTGLSPDELRELFAAELWA